MATSEVTKVRDKKNRAYLGDTSTYNPLSNPCIKEQKLSLKCLDDHNYDKEACEVYFLNYTNCKKFWNVIVQERRAKGTKPYLPLPEERDEIKAEFFKNLK